MVQEEASERDAAFAQHASAQAATLQGRINKLQHELEEARSEHARNDADQRQRVRLGCMHVSVNAVMLAALVVRFLRLYQSVAYTITSIGSTSRTRMTVIAMCVRADCGGTR